jgi:hypothetical protein
MEMLRTYDEFVDWIPHHLTRRQVLAMSAEGRFPPFARIYPRAPALWHESQIVQWISDNYRAVIPDYVARLEREGLTGAPFNGKSV